MAKIEFSLPSPTPQQLERFRSKFTVAENGCHVWHACRNPAGYGNFGVGSKTYLAHRVAYAWFVGSISADHELDHVKARGCIGAPCVNPAHLEAVTKAEHARRGAKANKTHCPYGHPYDEQNTIHTPTGRRCRTCHNTRMNEKLRRRRAEKNKGKNLTPGGHPSPLTREQVVQIRAMDGSFQSIARQFGVAHTTIANIKHGIHWREIESGE